MRKNNVGIGLFVDHKLLDEYLLRNTDGVTAECYIASQAGKSFEIQYAGRTTDHVMMRFFVDGALIGTYYLPPCTDQWIKGAETETPGVLRPFVFADMTTTDEDGIVQPDTARLEEVGTIKVEAYRVESNTTTSPTFTPSGWNDIGPVHEKAKKGGGHRVQLGEGIKYPDSMTVASVWRDPIDKPFTRFIFHYAPLELLQARRIAPLPSYKQENVGVNTIGAWAPKVEPWAGSSRRGLEANQVVASGSRTNSASFSHDMSNLFTIKPEPEDVKPFIKPDPDDSATQFALQQLLRSQAAYQRRQY